MNGSMLSAFSACNIIQFSSSTAEFLLQSDIARFSNEQKTVMNLFRDFT